MAAYTTLALVKDLLPDSYDTTALPDAKITEFIAYASRRTDEGVGSQYPYNGSQKFSDSPNAPATIEEIATWLAAARCWIRLKEANQFTEGNQAAEWREMAMADLKAIREGDIEVSDGGTALGQTSIYIAGEDTDRVFSQGEYIDGELQGNAGTLDDF